MEHRKFYVAVLLVLPLLLSGSCVESTVIIQAESPRSSVESSQSEKPEAEAQAETQMNSPSATQEAESDKSE